MSGPPATPEFDAIYARLRGPVLSLGYQMVGDAALAEDVVQETFLLVHRFLPQFRGEADVGTWVYRIAIRTALRVRQKRRGPTVPLREIEDQNSARHDEASLERAEDTRRLYAAMDKLPDKQRAVLTLLSI